MMRDYYKSKLVVGRMDGQNGLILFAMQNGGYDEYHFKDVNDLADTVREVVNDLDNSLTFDDPQNGPTNADAEHYSHYLSCFPPLEDAMFDYLVHLVKQTKN